MKKEKSSVRCDNCHCSIFRPENKTWKEMDVKWCCAPGDIARLFCKTCTALFEIKYNIDLKTGMTRIK